MGTYLSTPKIDKETEFGRGKHLSYAMCGMQGWRRTMEDAHFCTIRLAHCEEVSLFCVFDGHGGAEVAQFCAKYLPKELVKSAYFQRAEYDEALMYVFHQMDRLLLDRVYAKEVSAFKEASSGRDEAVGSAEDSNSIVTQLQEFKRIIIQSQPAESQMHAGCTALVALKCGNMLYVANAGDSRGVLCRAGQAIALSCDHKPIDVSERTRIEKAGGTVSNAGGVPRVNGNLNLSRAIGDLKYKANNDLPPEAQVITAHPDIRVFELSAADHFFMLACDGIWDVLSNEEAVQFVSKQLIEGHRPDDVTSRLVDRCLSADPKQSCGLGCDNMTIILIVLKSNTDGKPDIH